MKKLFYARFGNSHLAPNEQISTSLWSVLLGLVFLSPLWLPGGSSLPGFGQGMLFSGLVGFILSHIWNIFWLLRLEYRRLSAFGEDRWLAHIQPTNSSQTSIFSTIEWHIRWRYIPPWLLLIGWWIAFGHGQWIALVVTVVVVLLFYLFIRLRIDITESGITERGTGIVKKTVLWSEAQFFACYRLPLLFWGKNIVHYELSSQTARVSWIWMSNPHSPLTAWAAQLAPEEYQHQMQALCALVVEKTGLPLYNLSFSSLENH